MGEYRLVKTDEKNDLAWVWDVIIALMWEGKIYPTDKINLCGNLLEDKQYTVFSK